MARSCSCSGNCGASGPENEWSRREFLKVTGGGAFAAAIAPPGIWDTSQPEGGDLRLPRGAPRESYPRMTPRTYAGDQLSAVAMPLGGIATGSVWLDGQGRLSTWQIFNNNSEVTVPDSFLALRVQVGNDVPLLRVLQTVGEPGFEPMAALSYEGGYPVARLAFQDPDLPLEVQLEAYSPFIPLDTDNSSLPCAVFRVTVRNTGREPVRVDVVGTLQNAIGFPLHGTADHTRAPHYGKNRNRQMQGRSWRGVRLGQGDAPPSAGMLEIRRPGQAADGPEPVLWIDRLDRLAAAGQREDSQPLVDALARVGRDGGIAVAAGVSARFLDELHQAHQALKEGVEPVVFADFEGESYGGWNVEGEAFGDGPAAGTLPNQYPVTGYFGKGLVNSFRDGDSPMGRLASPPFTVQRRYLGFLIGGGAHPGRTCVNLVVDGEVVRTATGKNAEHLEPISWDLAEFAGKTAVLEIVDQEAGGWGHVNVDHVIFSDLPPEPLLGSNTGGGLVAMQLAFDVEDAEQIHAVSRTRARAVHPGFAAPGDRWEVRGHTRLPRFTDGDGGMRVLVATESGDPLMLMGPIGKGTLVLCLAPEPPWSWVLAAVGAARGTPLADGERLVPAAPGWGSMALVAFDRRASTTVHWTSGEYLAAQLRERPELDSVDDSGPSPRGETYNAAVAVPLRLAPGASDSATLAYTWHFPNADRFGHKGNHYATRFHDAEDVARYLGEHLDALWERTLLYHRTMHESNLPAEIVDAVTSQVTILRSQTCWRSADGYFAGYEGCYGCCPLNCTHVWNYAQTHARLFPDLDRNMRVSDLLVYLKETGETRHRQHAESGAFIDGHAATVCAAYRAYQTSPDRSFLDRVWPAVRKATDWLVERIDADRDGVPAGRQPNTYDCDVTGANTFIGSQYLAALEAASRMAERMGDDESRDRYRALREAGSRNQDARLWNGEYYIQLAEEPNAHEYKTGCHSDQLLGQWWAHMLGLGYLFPVERVRAALDAIARYNRRDAFAGFQQVPRRYCLDDEGGLLMCTWPKGGRPDPVTIYSDEVWTGIEYAVAGALLYEGKVDTAREIVRTARSRYDGRRREGVNSGPGGNPFNELECGKFYARAMSSWGLLLASQGFALDAPRGHIGFAPRWQPEDHRSFWSGAEGWGLFVQRRGDGTQTSRIEVRHGVLRVASVGLAVPEGIAPAACRATVAGRGVQSSADQRGAEVVVRLDRERIVREGEALEATLAWS